MSAAAASGWCSLRGANKRPVLVQGPVRKEALPEGGSTSVLRRGLRYDSWRAAVQLTIVDATHCCGTENVSVTVETPALVAVRALNVSCHPTRFGIPCMRKHRLL